MVTAAARAAGTIGTAAGRLLSAGNKRERALKIPVRGARALGAYHIAALFDRDKFIELMFTIHADKRI